ncbi:hypothetical protein QSH57_004713 [Fusarium oxysporum f. sp. vasinfectum]|nr:hypothetical protein QSH57_004713 [Fusarium oxysporum f. sp. vasinfectum]
MEHTNMIEKKYNYGGSRYMDCFRGANLRRTEIACAVWSCKALCGSALIGSAPYFLSQRAGPPRRQRLHGTNLCPAEAPRKLGAASSTSSGAESTAPSTVPSAMAVDEWT